MNPRLDKIYNLTVNIFILVIMLSCTNSKKYNISTLDKYLDTLISSDTVSGYVLIAKDGNIIYEKSLGFADREKGIPFTNTTQIDICSAGKLFTATLIMKLIEDGKINLGDRIDKFIPELEFGSKISVKNLLNHSSGLGQLSEINEFNYLKMDSCSNLIPFLKTQHLKFPPGTEFLYSSTGMMTLGIIIERVTKISYQKAVEKYIFKPLKMKNTLFVSYKDAQRLNTQGYKMACEYLRDKEGGIYRRELTQMDEQFKPLAAGGQWSNTSDLLIFFNSIFGYKILNKQTVNLMLKSERHTHIPGWSIGLGWTIIDKYNAAGHGGCTSSTIFNYRKENLTVIIITNYNFLDVFEISNNIEKIVFPEIKN